MDWFLNIDYAASPEETCLHHQPNNDIIAAAATCCDTVPSQPLCWTLGKSWLDWGSISDINVTLMYYYYYYYIRLLNIRTHKRSVQCQTCLAAAHPLKTGLSRNIQTQRHWKLNRLNHSKPLHNNSVIIKALYTSVTCVYWTSGPKWVRPHTISDWHIPWNNEG